MTIALPTECLCSCTPQKHAAAARHRAGERPHSAEEHSQSVEGDEGLERVPEVHQHALQALPQTVGVHGAS